MSRPCYSPANRQLFENYPTDKTALQAAQLTYRVWRCIPHPGDNMEGFKKYSTWCDILDECDMQRFEFEKKRHQSRSHTLGDVIQRTATLQARRGVARRPLPPPSPQWVGLGATIGYIGSSWPEPVSKIEIDHKRPVGVVGRLRLLPCPSCISGGQLLVVSYRYEA